MAEQLERANTELESFISGMPGPVADFFSWALTPLKELLEMVSGDPDDLIRAAQVWADSAEQFRGLSEEHKSAGETLLSTWKDDAADGFKGMQDQLDQAGQQLVEGMNGVKELLVSAAEAAVEAFNLILDLIIDIVLFILADFILMAAMAIISFGASMAAWVAKSLAGLARAASKIASIMTKVARFLDKVADFMRKIAKLFKHFKEVIKDLKALKSKPWNKKLYSKEGLGDQITASVGLAPFKLAFNAGSPVDIPGATDLGKDIYNLGEDAVEGAGRERPEGFDESVLDRG